MHLNKYKKGELFRLHCGLWNVQQGLLHKIGYDVHGNQIGINVYTDGDYVLVDERTGIYECYAYRAISEIAITRVRDKDLNGTTLLKQLANTENLIFALGQKMHYNEADEPAEQLRNTKLYAFLQWLSSKAGWAAVNSFTQTEIAEFTHLSRPTVSRYFKKMWLSGITKQRIGKKIRKYHN